MTKTEAIAYFKGNASEMARALGVDQSTIYSWGDFPPIGRQYQLHVLSGGKLKVEPAASIRKAVKAGA